MLQINPAVAKALVNLEGDEDFAIVLEWLANEGEDVVKTLLSNPKVEFTDWLRGYGACVTHFVDGVVKARKYLEDIERR